MKRDQWQGKTVQEVEKEIKQRGSMFRLGLRFGPHLILWLVALLIISALLGVIWQQHRELAQLRALSNSLAIEKKALLLENELLQENVETKPAADPVEPPPQIQPDQKWSDYPQNERYIFYAIEPGDTIEHVSVLFFEDESYAKRLAQANNITTSTILHVDQIIQVPKELLADAE